MTLVTHKHPSFPQGGDTMQSRPWVVMTNRSLRIVWTPAEPAAQSARISSWYRREITYDMERTDSRKDTQTPPLLPLALQQNTPIRASDSDLSIPGSLTLSIPYVTLPHLSPNEPKNLSTYKPLPSLIANRAAPCKTILGRECPSAHLLHRLSRTQCASPTQKTPGSVPIRHRPR